MSPVAEGLLHSESMIPREVSVEPSSPAASPSTDNECPIKAPLLSDILLPPQAAAYVGLAVPTLAKMRCWGDGPEFMKLGRKVVYRRAALDAWLAARVARNTADAARLPTRLADPPTRGAIPEAQIFDTRA